MIQKEVVDIFSQNTGLSSKAKVYVAWRWAKCRPRQFRCVEYINQTAGMFQIPVKNQYSYLVTCYIYLNITRIYEFVVSYSSRMKPYRSAFAEDPEIYDPLHCRCPLLKYQIR